MDARLKEGSQKALERYGDLLSRYTAQEGYTIRPQLAREVALLGMDPEALGRPLFFLQPRGAGAPSDGGAVYPEQSFSAD